MAVTVWQTVKRSVQCHAFAQSPPDRSPNDKYPVNTSHRSDLCKNVSLQCCLVLTLIHTQSDTVTCVCVCVYMHVLHNVETWVAGRTNERKKRSGTAVNAACDFGHACYKFDSPAVECSAPRVFCEFVQWCADLGRQSSRWLNFVPWSLIFAVPRYGICFTVPFWRIEL